MRHPGKPLFLLLLLCLLCHPAFAHADGFKPGDLLVCVGSVTAGDANGPIDKVLEFAGTSLRQTLSIPLPLSGGEAARTLSVDYKGNLQVYNGTFSPSLATYSQGGWSQQTFDGWSTVNNTTYGGVAAYKNYVFVSDMATAYNGTPSGVIRFNMDDGTAQRFADGTDFETLQVGYDGLLYAVQGYNGFATVISVFDPDSMAQVNTINAPAEATFDGLRSVAVNRNGELFLVGLAGVIYHCDASGNILNSLDTGHYYTHSLALSTDGRIAVAREDGYVILTDESLSSFTTFQAYTSRSAIDWTIYVAFVPYRSAPSDFNGDGKPDILWQNQRTGDLSYWLMNGTQSSSAGYLARSIPLNWQTVGTPDLNGDGKADILWRNQNTGDVSYWIMSGTNPSFSGYIAYNVPLEWKIVGTPDLNRDGKPDILWQNQTTGDVSYWLMNGTNAYASGTIASNIPLEWQIVGTADLDGDGNPDLLWRNQSTGDGSYWLLQGTTPLSSGYFATAIPLDWKIVGTPDLNGDGKADILWQSQSTGAVSYWIMDGTQFVSADYIVRSMPLEWQITTAH